MDDKYRSKVRLIIAGVAKYGEISFRVEGESMSPVLKSGSLVKIQKTPFGAIRPTDWVAIIKRGCLMVHEVLFVANNYLVTWGVNNSRTDGRIEKKQVLGTVKKNSYWRRRHLFYLGEAKAILNELERLKVKNLILKGPPWQIAKYGHLLDRPSADIDWLIDKNEYRVVKKILNVRGYRLRRTEGVKKEYYLGTVPKVSEMSYVKKVTDAKLTIDLHLQAVKEALSAWYKEPVTSDNMSRLTKHLLGQRVFERGWPLLPDTEGLFYLCLNLVIHHAGRRVYQLANIAQLIERGRINWGEMETLIRTYRVGNYIYFPLLWAHRLFKVKVPLLGRVKPTMVRLWLAKMVINRWTVMRPTPVRKWFSGKVTPLAITYLRLVLSFGRAY